LLRRIYIPKGKKIIEGWTKLHKEELHNLCNSPSIIRIINSKRMRGAEHVGSMEKWMAYSILVGKPEGMRPLGKPNVKGKIMWRPGRLPPSLPHLSMASPAGALQCF
jgi:hypothetical protein